MSEAERPERMATLSLGVILRRTPGATRWAKWAWRAVGLIPGAGPGNWSELRREGNAVDFHAATVTLELHRAETEAYMVALNGKPPSVFAILRPAPGAPEGRPDVLKLTASAYEAQDHADNGEDIVEPVPMPEGLEAWIGAFCERHHHEEEFVKRKRRPHFDDRREDGIGDARIRQTADVYRAPGSIPKGRRMSEREGRLSRWSRRKREAEAAEREASQPQTPAAENGGEPRAEDLAGLPDAEVLEKLGLKDPDEMQPGDDFSAFLKQAVPEHLRRRALRRLWRSNPVLANLDGLNDYDTDFTGGSVAPGMLKTVYKVGLGLVRDLPEAAEEAGETKVPATGAAAEPAAESPGLQAESKDKGSERQILQDDDRGPARPRRRMRFDFEG